MTMARGGNRFVLFMVSLAALPTAIGNAAADDLAVGAAPTDQLQESSSPPNVGRKRRATCRSR
jgi:hypothetical protein